MKQESFCNFSFRLAEIPRVALQIGWTEGATSQSWYRCPPFTATCIVLRGLSSPCSWTDLEVENGMHSSALSEMFWEVIEWFYSVNYRRITTLSEYILVGPAVCMLTQYIKKMIF